MKITDRSGAELQLCVKMDEKHGGGWFPVSGFEPSAEMVDSLAGFLGGLSIPELLWNELEEVERVSLRQEARAILTELGKG